MLQVPLEQTKKTKSPNLSIDFEDFLFGGFK